MSVIVEFSIPAEEFILGKALQQTSGLSVELEKMIPTSGASIPYFWVIGEERDEFDAILEQEPELKNFETIDEIDGRRLYRTEWDSAVDTFVQAIVEYDIVLLEAGGDVDVWEFQLRFPDSQELSAFHTHCDEHGIALTINSVYNPVEPAAVNTRGLTESQLELVERLYDAGYFDVPRKVTLAEVADELDISDQAVNERLRRGLQNLIEATVKSEVAQD